MVMTEMGKNRTLSVFSLVMINVIAVDSLRTLPFGAKLGSSLIFYYAVIAILFFFPVALVTAELATTYPKRGGVYIWVREAFGHRTGFLVVWLQWMYNLAWYPTILATISLIFAYLMDSQALASPLATFVIVLIVFWLSTLGNCFGMALSSWISTFCTWIGTLIPMIVIIALGFWWIVVDNNIPKIDLSWSGIFPKVDRLEDLVLITPLIFGVMGLEMSAVHAQEVKNPKRDYPKALKFSVLIILFTLTLSSLSIALVIPGSEMNIVTGVVQASNYFFDNLGIPWMQPVICISIIVGAVGAIAAWIIGPTKAMLVAAQDDNLPKIFAKTNKRGVPVAILVLQGLIVSILSLLYITLPTVESAFFLLTQMTTIMALLMNVLMFFAAIWLRYNARDVHRPYKIPGGNWGIWIVGLMGGFTGIFAIFLGFVPPSQIPIGNPMTYKLILLIGLALFCLPAYFVHKKQRKIKVQYQKT